MCVACGLCVCACVCMWVCELCALDEEEDEPVRCNIFLYLLNRELGSNKKNNKNKKDKSNHNHTI